MKELDEENGINWYYFGARYYPARDSFRSDPVIGRWLTIDHLAFRRPGLTPYHYVQNNPFNRFDPDGRFDKKLFKKGTKQLIFGTLSTASAGLYIAGTSGAGAALGGTFLFMGGLGSMGLGLMEIVQAIRDEPSPLPKGLMLSMLMEGGMSEKEARTVVLTTDITTLIADIFIAQSRAGTTLDDLVAMIDAFNTTDDVKEALKEKLKRDQAQKEKEAQNNNEDEKRKRKEEEKKKEGENR